MRCCSPLTVLRSSARSWRPEEHTVKPELINVLGSSSLAGPLRQTIRMAARIPCSASRLSGSVSAGSRQYRRQALGHRGSPGSEGNLMRRSPILWRRCCSMDSRVLAVLWGTGLLAARRIARPIQLLHGGVQEIGSGRLDRRLELKTGDEIETLGRCVQSDGHESSAVLRADRTTDGRGAGSGREIPRFDRAFSRDDLSAGPERPICPREQDGSREAGLSPSTKCS